MELSSTFLNEQISANAKIISRNKKNKGCDGVGEIEYDAENEEWTKLSSTFLNEKTSANTKIISRNKKTQKFKHMIRQRNHGQFIASPPIIKKINRRITLVFHYLASIEKSANDLFCKEDIKSIDQAIDVYEKCIKKIPQEWSISTSTDILRTLPKLKANLAKFEKYLLAKFYLLIKLFREKNIPAEKNIKILIQNTKKEPQFLLGSKKF